MNNIYVIKCGGSFVMNKHWLEPFLLELKSITKKGYSIILVHGGGPQADDLANKLKIPIKKIQGKRITDLQTLQIAKMVYVGLTNTDFVSACINNGIQAVGISGVSGKLIEVSKRPKKEIKNSETGKTELVDFGYVGDIKTVNKQLLLLLLQSNYIPVISCLGVDISGQVFNINADSLAVHVAIAMEAKKLIYITDVEGVAQNRMKTSFLKSISMSQAQEFIDQGIITGGMIPKIDNSSLALQNKIKTVHILGPLKTKKDWKKALINENFGTLITQE